MKILVIQQKMIGDVLTSSIIFEALRKKYPRAELHYLLYSHTRAVVENNPFIDKLLLFNPDQDAKPLGLLAFSKRIKREKYKVVIDVYSKINTAFLTIFSGAEKRISYHKWYTAKAYTHTFYPKPEPRTNAGFAIENRMQLLQAISPDFPPEIKPKIYLTNSEKQSARQLLEEAGIIFERPLVMVSILGSSRAKTYPLRYMADLLDFVVSNTDSQLLFNYIPKQEEEARKLYNLCAPDTRSNIHFDIFGKDLREFLAITSHTDALIGNEGGAVNMAKALDIPTFAIFSPQIKKENWSIYENGETNVSVHLGDFSPNALEGFSRKQLTKKAAHFYELLFPNLIFAPLRSFLDYNVINKKDSLKENQ